MYNCVSRFHIIHVPKHYLYQFGLQIMNYIWYFGNYYVITKLLRYYINFGKHIFEKVGPKNLSCFGIFSQTWKFSPKNTVQKI